MDMKCEGGKRNEQRPDVNPIEINGDLSNDLRESWIKP